MGITFLEDWFSVSIRRNRKSFFLATATLTVLLTGIALIIYLLDIGQRSKVWIIFAFAIPYFICGYTLTSQRLRDMAAQRIFV